MSILISSQRYIDDSIVESKIASADYTVSVSPVFEIDGIKYQVLIDGHHSFAAAALSGVEPIVKVLTERDHDAVALIDDISEFLTAVYMGDDYYDVRTGVTVF